MVNKYIYLKKIDEGYEFETSYYVYMVPFLDFLVQRIHRLYVNYMLIVHKSRHIYMYIKFMNMLLKFFMIIFELPNSTFI